MEEKDAKTAISELSTEKKKLRPCCACPETRKKRDECLRYNEEIICKELIENHNECLRKEGFLVNIDKI
jgi:cytochrome c oxidase assembly protein subunit 17